MDRRKFLTASGGAAAKLAAGVATVVVIAGGTIGATRALHGHQAHERGAGAADASRHSSPPGTPISPATSAVVNSPPSPAQAPSRREPPHTTARTPAANSEPGGFGFLGVPTQARPKPTPPARIASASASPSHSPAASASSGREEQRGGGPFSP